MTRWHALCLWLATLLSVTGALAADAGAPVPKAKSVAPASYQVSNKKYGELLRPEDANSAEGTRLVLYPAQPWKCMTWKVHPAGEGAFYLQNHFTSKTFAIDTKASQQPYPVTQMRFAKTPGDRPLWQFTKLADATYKITDAKSGLALTAVKDSAGATARIVAQEWRDTDEQKWQLNPIDPKQLTM